MTEGSRTESHVAADPGPRGAARKVLLAAHPKAACLTFPTSGTKVGRSWFADAGAPDRKISSEHCQLFAKGGTLRDLGSRNGTFINGVPLVANDPPTPIPEGAVVRMGNSVFVYREAWRGPAEPQAPLGDLAAPFGVMEARRQIAGWRAKPPTVVLVQGETGTGKELTAAAIARALRPDGRFEAMNVAAQPEGLFEAELFGHDKGAYSGASEPRLGLFRRNNGGVVLLDEIGDLRLELQAKLLRVLEDPRISPVGSDDQVTTDVLILAATNKDLEAMAADGTFRADLWARLQPRIGLAPLSERREDIWAIAQALIRAEGLADENAKVEAEVEAVEWLLLQRWNENARSLRHALRRAFDRLREADEAVLKLWALGGTAGGHPAQGSGVLTRDTLREATAATANESESAQWLGVSRFQLIRYRDKLESGA